MVGTCIKDAESQRNHIVILQQGIIYGIINYQLKL